MSQQVSHDPAETGVRSRREFLLACGAAATALSGGCREPLESTSPAAAPRDDVPLRITLCGNQQDREAIEGGWAAVSSQPLEFTVIPVDRHADGGWVSSLSETAKHSDLVIYPVLAIAELAVTETIAPLSDDEFELTEQQNGTLLAALRNGVAMYSGRYMAAPLGAHQPSIIAAETVDSPATWQEYDQWVESLGGAAAEPLADGWAAAMFLWRAATTSPQGWLFGRERLDPLLDDEPYRQVLTQMRRTAERYKIKRSAPEEIWSQLKSGALQGAIGFAFPGETSQSDLTFNDLPGDGLTRILVDPFAPVASLASRSRQSANSKTFIRWLAGGEGVDRVRRQSTSLTITSAPADTDAGGWQAEDGYAKWLSERLSTPTTLPTLKLHDGDRYYAALDRNVVRCLQGESEPNESLAVVKDEWNKISREVGLERQQRAWRRAQS